MFSISLLPLSLLTILQNTQAFWTALLGYLINNEAFLRIECVGIIACFIGVLFMALSKPEEGSFEEENSMIDLEYARLIGIVVMVFVAFNDSMLAVLARRMRDVHFSVIMFWFSALGMIMLVGTLVSIAIFQRTVPAIFTYDMAQMKNLVLTGIFSALNLTSLTIAYQNDKSATISLLAYIALVYAFAADVWFFDHKFVLLELLGSAIILFFNVFTIWFKMVFTPEQRGGKYETELDTEHSHDSTDYEDKRNEELAKILNTNH